MKLIFYFSLFFISISQIYVPNAFSNTVNKIILTETNNAEHIKTYVNDIITIKLKANISTGYTWDFIYAKNILEQTEKPEFSAENPQLPGSPGVIKFIFTAKNKGITKLEGKYKRPWEKTGQLRSFSLEIEVLEKLKQEK